ncbi:MAG: prolyl oligopeptidase family serine peptidase [Akkermansiaceae bacterium]|nr:prolyl oligopeptidase family serine peptidase [Akkermansiaceae bacterium]
MTKPYSTHFSRREWLGRAAGGTIAGVAGAHWLAGVSALAQENPAATPEIAPLNRFPRMLHEYYVARVRAVEKRALERKAALKTKADAEAHVKDVRARIARAFAPMPKQRTPLNPQITGVLERDGYRIEKVIFESRPKFYVTANLYLPAGAGAEKKAPGVVGTCGHSSNGKAAEAYQSFAQGLARMGYACLIYDPIGQGERLQYFGADGKPTIGPGTREHNVAGNQQELVGEFFGSWRAWDGIRALDYLLSRPEVDPEHVGVTGNSGGGTMTTWLLGVEQRWTMGAPACFVTTWRRNMENELPQDNEQCPPRSLAMGLDHDDYLAAMAPKPVIVLAKERDYFDARGAEEVYGRLRRLYGLLGHEDNVGLHIGPTTHGYTQENREAMYRFFNAVTRVSDAQTEPAITIEPDEAIQCTETGQVVPERKGRTVFSFTKAKANALKKKRDAAPPKGEDLKKAVLASLRMPERDPAAPPNARNLRAGRGKREYPKPFYINYAIDTEPRIQAVCTMLGDEALYSRPPKAPEGGPDRALLYIADFSSDAELRGDDFAREWIAAESGECVPVFACDVRGVGESLPGTTPDPNPHSYYGADYFYAAYANMLNRPLLGGRTFDVLRVLDFLAEHGWKSVSVAAKGRGALPAGLAALLDERIVRLRLADRLESWHAVATEENYDLALPQMLPGVLSTWDLPDVWAALEPKLG